MTKEQKRFELIAQYAGQIFQAFIIESGNKTLTPAYDLSMIDMAMRLADEVMKHWPEEPPIAQKIEAPDLKSAQSELESQSGELSARELVRRMQGYCESHALCCMQTDNLFDWAKKELEK